MIHKFNNSNFLTKYMAVLLILVAMILLLSILTSPVIAVHIAGNVYYGIIGIILVILFLLSVFFVKKVYNPLKKLESKLIEFGQSRNINLKNLFSEPKTMLEQIDELLEMQKTTIEQEHARAIMTQKMKYAKLQNQINPHFLYNILENIRGQAIVDDNYTIAEMTEALARYFRYNISKDNDVVKLSQELENIQTYVQIQQYRFRDRFIFQIYNHDNSDVIYHSRIPKMTLQPIVENAIFHGLENKIEKGHIDIHIEAASRQVTVLVSDDGVGMDAETLKILNNKLKYEDKKIEWVDEKENSNGIALENVNNRLRLLYGEDYGIKVSSTRGVGTEVEITIPLMLDH